MSDIAIKVQNISKRYRIGLKEELHDTFFGALASWVKYPLSNFRRVQKLSKFSGDGESEDIIWALRDVSFEVKHGEVLGIIGKNGAGKSTLLKILCRITEPTSGNASIHGRVASLLEVGTGFHQELTGRENVFLNGAILGMTKAEIECKFDEIVDFSGVEKFIDTPVKRYSSGMRVRLAFSVAAHLDPEIMLIDEVLAVGDVEFQKKCLGKMEEVAGRGRTVLFVSHNITSIQKLCPRTILVDNGRIIKDGMSSEVCEHYLFAAEQENSFVIDFIDGKDQLIQFIRAELFNSKNEKTNVFRADESFKFRITYQIKEFIRGASVVINICTSTGESLWAMSDKEAHPYLFNGRKPGIWEYECIVPKKVLRPGRYLVALGAGGVQQYFHHPPLFPFEISIQGYWRPEVSGGPLVLPMEIKKPVMIKPV